jgi:hypothetical protein
MNATNSQRRMTKLNGTNSFTFTFTFTFTVFAVFSIHYSNEKERVINLLEANQSSIRSSIHSIEYSIKYSFNQSSMTTTGLIVGLSAYVVACLLAMYFCVIADPEDSDIAYLMQVSLPNKIWQLMSKVMGKRQMDAAAAVLERALVLVYLAVVLGCWTIVFWYIYPWISTSTHVSDMHKYVGYAIFVGCVGSWRLCSASSPGIITVKTFKHFDHYPYDSLLFLPDKRCETTNVIRIPRSKFDRLKYHQHVPRYDHFCGWVYNTIGEQNYRWFLLFLSIHVLMCFYGSTVCMLLFRGEIFDKKLLEITFFDRSTGQKVKSNWFITFQYLFSRRTYESAVLAVMFVMGIALGGFLSYHVSQIFLFSDPGDLVPWRLH